MLTVDDAVGELRRRCDAQWLNWALGKGTWPLRITLGAPQGTAFDRDVIGAQRWAGAWRSAAKSGTIPGTVTTQARRARKLGTHDLPTLWTIAQPADALRVSPEAAERYLRASQRLQEAVNLDGVPWERIDQVPTRVARAIVDLDNRDWQNAVAVASYLAGVGAGDAVMVRQLAIPGVHSKWIEQNALLIGAMIGIPADRNLGDPLTRLIKHIGLQAKQTPVHVTLSCPRLRAAAAGLQRFEATIPVLNNSSLRPAAVLIVENLEPGHTLALDLPGLVLIHGLGAAAPILANLEWISSAAEVLYWGDIDRAGLSILASARRMGIPARSVLMDEATMDAYPGACHDTDTQMDSHDIPAELSAAEVALYRRLNSYQQEHGTDRQLEQEHIPIALARIVIQDAVKAKGIR